MAAEQSPSEMSATASGTFLPQTDELSDAELDAIETDLAKAERTLGLLTDDDVDPAAVTSWLAES